MMTTPISYQGIDTSRFLQPQSKNINRIMRAILKCEFPSICVSGGLGTGKTQSILWCIHVLCCICKDLRVAIIRNEKASMPTTLLPSFKDMLIDGFVETPRMPFRQVYGGQVRTSALYYKSGSECHFSGIDDVGKILGLNAGLIFWNQGERSSKSDYDDLVARLRGNAEWVNPFTGKRGTLFLSDANPGPPNHHLVQKSESGALKMFHTSLEDNVFFYRDNEFTQSGLNYKQRLDEAYDADDYRRARFVRGEWAAASSVIFPQFNPDLHVTPMAREDIPSDYRWSVSVDFGIAHGAGICLFAHSKDRKDIRVFETWLQTGYTSSELIPVIRDMMERNGLPPKTTRVIAETAGDGKQTLERGGLRAVNAKKSDKHFGIDMFRQYLSGVDGRRLRINANAMKHPPDAELLRQGKSTNLVDELLSLQHLPLEKQTTGTLKDDLWDKSLGGDDLTDACIYGVTYIAITGGYIPSVIATSSTKPLAGLFSA